jgi:hypothetical protein
MNVNVSELRKLTSLRLPWVVLSVAAVLSATIGAVNVHQLGRSGHIGYPAVGLAAAQPSWFMLVVVAVLASAGEFQHRTVVTTLLATPNRVGVLARKAVAATAFGVLLTTTAIASSILSGFVTATMDGASVRGGGIDEWLAVAGAVVVGGLWAVMASALGLLTRSTAVSLTAVLLWKFVIEGIIPIVLRHPGFGAWMPSGAAAAVVDAPGGSLSAPLAALVLAGYGLALCLAAAFSFLTKDPL